MKTNIKTHDIVKIDQVCNISVGSTHLQLNNLKTKAHDVVNRPGPILQLSKKMQILYWPKKIHTWIWPFYEQWFSVFKNWKLSITPFSLSLPTFTPPPPPPVMSQFFIFLKFFADLWIAGCGLKERGQPE